MKKLYECCICHKPMQRNKRLVYQEFENIEPYGFFRSKSNYDICDDCFKIFKKWIGKHHNENIIKLGRGDEENERKI